MNKYVNGICVWKLFLIVECQVINVEKMVEIGNHHMTPSCWWFIQEGLVNNEWVEVEKDQDVGIISENLPTKCLPLQKRKVVTWWGRNLDDANMTKHSTSMSPLVGQGDITCCNMKSPASCLWCCFQECMARSDQKEMSNRNRSKVILQNKRPILFKTEGH